MEKENRPFNEDKERTENTSNEKNENLTSKEKKGNDNKKNSKNSHKLVNESNTEKEKDIELKKKYINNNDLKSGEIKCITFSYTIDNKSESKNKEANMNEIYKLNFKNNEDNDEECKKSKTLEILEESLEKQIKTAEENAKTIFFMESKINEYLNKEKDLSIYKNTLQEEDNDKKNKEGKEKTLVKKYEEKTNLDNQKESSGILINEGNINTVIIKEDNNYKSNKNERGETAYEKNIIDELFYDNYYEQNDDVDVWRNLNYAFVEDIKILNIYEDKNEISKFNEEKETETKIKKKKMRKHLLKSIEGEEENELEKNIKYEKEKEKDKTEDFENKKNEDDKDNEAKKLSLNAIDKSFIQVPLKCILNTFRNIQKELEKNIMIITLFIEKKLTNLSDDICVDKLNTIIEKLQVLKNKVNESKVLLNKYIKRLVNRLKYIYFEADIQLENLKHDFRFETYENRINWLIDEYLSRYGYFDTEEVFCKRYKLENYSDADIYKEYLEIINELKNHNTKPALEWCQKYKSQLKKIDSNIESELHLQHVINLIFEKKFFEAVEYIKKFVSQSESCISSDIRYIITHIGLNSSTLSLKLFNEKRWKKVIKLFKKVYSEISGVLNKPLLELLLKAGISVIKTDQCGKKKSTKCPTCMDELKNTINHLPNIQKTRSFLVCPFTNEVMDEKNPPFTTPDGHVFSEKAISLFRKSDDIFVCPVTEEAYRIEELSRLFI
ncbi:conserved Plasmodium protein, unknown function [Plasmodium relictum]|uniref:CTLH domain-containing protein n=1 Tax=Plasmodium relictum TaxID=85471 RepID=A0A1J1HAC8_PLARL|nr:conserved Plasmodium protein, unknown function [Plasmodium relictum]CRH01768.1 conserved Plasmodium protein, unknown function [Plasmodium relictum]